MNENHSTLEDQIQLVNKIFKSNKYRWTKDDDEAYLLSKKWYDQCNDFYSHLSKENQDKDTSLDEKINLPPIDNNDLIDNDKHFFNTNIPEYFFLNQNKKINIDFIAIKTKDWTNLLSEFGGGPAIPVPVTQYNPFQTTLHPVTDFINISVTYKENINEKFVTYKEINGKVLEDSIRSFFDVPKSEKTRLTCLRKVLQSDKNLNQQFINPQCHFTLEYEDSQGNWMPVQNQNDEVRNYSNFSSSRKNVEKQEIKKVISDKTFHQKEQENEEKTDQESKSIPPLSEQLKIFRELERKYNEFTEGENNAYLISINWFRLWKSSVDPSSRNLLKIGNYDESDSEDENQNNTRIPPIDNRDLMMYDEKQKIMRPDRSKKEMSDFRILHPVVWKKLYEWYGGGPEIAVPVYYSPTQKKPSPVIHFYDIPIDYKDKKSENFFEIGKNTPLSIIHARANVLYDVPENEDTRICVLNQSSYRVLDSDRRQTLDSYVLFSPDTHLVLDFKEKGSHEWNLNATSICTYRSSSSMRPITNSQSYSDLNEVNKENQNSDSREDERYSQSQHSLDRILPSLNHDNDDDRYISNESHYSHTYYDRTVEGPGICGLMNLGNTCFFNSGIQCLVHTRLLVKYILKGRWEHELNRSNPIGMHGEVAEAFADLTYRIWSGRFNNFSPNQMKDVIGRFAPQFSGYGQQDSHELITFMLDGIHEDLNRVTKKPVVESINGDGTNDEEIADESWRRYKMRNDSIIVDLFHSQLRSRLVCPKCKKVTVVFDPYMSIQLPLNKPNKTQLNLIFVPSKFSKSYNEIQDDKGNDFLFDVNCKQIKISISKNRRLQPSDISELVSAKVGRKVNVVLCSKESLSTSSCLFKIGANSQGQNYALEIPEPNPEEGITKDTKFVVCSLVSKAKKKYSFFSSSYDEYVDIMPPFLLPIPDFNISQEEILGRCEEFLEGFWSGDDTPLTEDQKTFKDELKIELLRTDGDDENSIKDNQKILIEKNFTGLYPSREYDPRISSSILPVAVNQATMGENYHFSFYLYLKHLKDRKYRSFSSSYSDSVSSSSVELEKCFKYFSTNETLDENNKWFCPNCRDFVCADKKMDIWSAPEVLVIQLKRFIRYNECYMRKLDTTVNYPSEIDISQYLAGPQHNEKMIYRLYAVSEHSGSLNGGHYTAHAKVSKKDMSEEGGKWYSFNDSYVSKSSKSAAHNSGAYVLFYERVSNNEPKSDS